MKTFTWLYTTVLATSLLRKGFCISSWRLHSFKNVSVYRHLVWTYKDREVVIICLLHGCSSDATSSSTLTALECTHFVCLFMEATDGKYNPHLHVLPSIMSLTLGQNLSNGICIHGCNESLWPGIWRLSASLCTNDMYLCPAGVTGITGPLLDLTMGPGPGMYLCGNTDIQLLRNPPQLRGSPHFTIWRNYWDCLTWVYSHV